MKTLFSLERKATRQILNNFTILKSIIVTLVYASWLKKKISLIIIIIIIIFGSHTLLSQMQQHFALFSLFFSPHSSFLAIFFSICSSFLATLSFVAFSFYVSFIRGADKTTYKPFFNNCSRKPLVSHQF